MWLKAQNEMAGLWPHTAMGPVERMVRPQPPYLHVNVLYHSTSPPSRANEMAINHGIFMSPHNTRDGSEVRLPRMQFRYGIMRIFEGLRLGPFLSTSVERRRAAELEHHFRNVCQRLVFTLQRLDGLMQQLTSMHSSGDPPTIDAMRVNFEAETLADHLMTYLSMLVDDVAVMITQATSYLPSKPGRAVDSMGKLRRSELRAEAAFRPLRHLLDETDIVGSWWDLGFATGIGARQLVIHNQHLVQFQLSCAPGGSMEARAVILSPFAERPFPCTDYFKLLRTLFAGLFVWLDRAENDLVGHLKTVHSTWEPMAFCPCFSLPVGLPSGTTIFSSEYFPIPTCEGSAQLPWTVEVRAADA